MKVYVYTFEPAPDSPAGVGGFEWRKYKTQMLADLRKTIEDDPEGHYVYCTHEFEVDPEQGAYDITDQVDDLLYGQEAQT